MKLQDGVNNCSSQVQICVVTFLQLLGVVATYSFNGVVFQVQVQVCVCVQVQVCVCVEGAKLQYSNALCVCVCVYKVRRVLVLDLIFCARVVNVAIAQLCAKTLT